MAKMGRPRAEIDKKEFEGLCGLQCTYEEVCDWFGVTQKTLNAWCRRTYGKTFSHVFREKRGKGKISLRRMQWQLAEKSPAMAIFLGKNFLGQSDRTEMEVNTTVQSNPLDGVTTEEIKKLIDKEG